MSGSTTPSVSGNVENNAEQAFRLPLPAMVRALCRASATGADVLYDVVLKIALMLDATAQTYGLATFAQQRDGRPRLKWVEGLEESEIAEAERRVAEVLA